MLAEALAICRGVSDKEGALHCGWMTHNLIHQTKEFRNDLIDNDREEGVFCIQGELGRSGEVSQNIAEKMEEAGEPGGSSVKVDLWGGVGRRARPREHRMGY